MKNDRSKTAIMAIYEDVRNLEVVSFDENGKRTMTYSGLQIYSALSEKLKNEAMGRRSYIVLHSDVVEYGKKMVTETPLSTYDYEDCETVAKVAAKAFALKFDTINRNNSKKRNNFDRG